MIDNCTNLIEAEAILRSKVAILANLTATSSDLQKSSDSSIARLQSESSMTSEEDTERDPLCVYSESELSKLSRALIRLYEKFFRERSIQCLPSFYYDIIDSMITALRQSPFIDSTLIDLFSTFLWCVQLRLFSWILNYQYHYFVMTDLFEYLVNELQSPSSTQLPFASFRRATKYSMERLERCEAEIPHLSSFIQGSRSFSKIIHRIQRIRHRFDRPIRTVSLPFSVDSRRTHRLSSGGGVEALAKQSAAQYGAVRDYDPLLSVLSDRRNNVQFHESEPAAELGRERSDADRSSFQLGKSRGSRAADPLHSAAPQLHSLPAASDPTPHRSQCLSKLFSCARCVHSGRRIDPHMASRRYHHRSRLRK